MPEIPCQNSFLYLSPVKLLSWQAGPLMTPMPSQVTEHVDLLGPQPTHCGPHTSPCWYSLYCSAVKLLLSL